MSEALKGSPALRSDEVRRCVADNRSTPDQKTMMLKLMNLAPDRDPVRVGCERVVEGLASGRLGYDDYRKLQFGEVTPQVIRLLQAR